MDPWRVAGIQADLNPDLPATVIEEYSHSIDWFSISEYDTNQMKEVKNRVKQLVKLGLSQSQNKFD